MNERSSLLSEKDASEPFSNTTRELTGLFERPSSTAQIRPEIPSIRLSENSEQETTSCSGAYISSTIIGSVVFLLYQIVFCLAQAATVVRPHSTHSSTGTMAQMAALGIFVAGPVFLWELSDKVPAIYPASDLFLAPFLAELASRIDTALLEDGQENNDRVFMATFSVLLMFGFLLSGILCVLAARVKLADLGAFLPYSVLCGFFSTIGILMWTLGISVDTGHKIGDIVRDPSLWGLFLVHHSPSFCVGLAMHLLGKRHPFLVILLVISTVIMAYIVMFLTGTTLIEAQSLGWFFSTVDFAPMQDESSWDLAPPLPFGAWGSLYRHEVNWKAFMTGLPPMISLAFLYLIRSSLHSAALKKNIPNLTRKPAEEASLSPSLGTSLRLEQSTREKKEKKKALDLGFILERGYGYSQLASAIVGGITVAPSVAAGKTLFELGAEHAAPQYGSCFLVIFLYSTSFTMVQYIPKPAFSCLMVLAGLDMCRSWIVGSYQRTKAKTEWAVAPVLVALAFSVGLLNAIAIGVGISTFIFVANFYRSGLVRFVGDGLSLRSTVERGVDQSQWLDQHGDMIQILVLQNYIFFGNGVSALSYISTMFDDELEEVDMAIPPMPKYLVIDFTLVSGMDTSAVDIVEEIIGLCQSHHCRLYLAGVAPSLKSMLQVASIKPNPSAGRSPSRQWSYASDLESALAKSEDGLLSKVFRVEERNARETSSRLRQRSDSIVEDGFLYALKKIDEQHGLNTMDELSGLREYTHPVELQTGELLVRNEDGDHGLYFVETGLMRVVRGGSHASVDSVGNASSLLESAGAGLSIGHLNARSETMGRQATAWKEHRMCHQHEQSFRLARFGQGWVIGSIETSSGGLSKPGHHVAMAPCRLHHLPRSSILQAEELQPRAMMNLYKTVSLLASKRQEKTIEQLGQFVHILNSPVPRLQGGGKRALMKLQSGLTG